MKPSSKSNPKLNPNHLAFEALGTPWVIDAEVSLDALEGAIRERLEVFDKAYSRFRDDSIVSLARHRLGVHVFPDDFAVLYALYDSLYRLTQGKMTPLIGVALEDAGYDANYRLTPRKIHTTPPLHEAVEWDGERRLTLFSPVLLDFGAAGKGYAVDHIATLLLDNDIKEFTIDASGDIRHSGQQSERIGLEHPLDATKVIGVANIRNASLCASATNRRVWNGFTHVLDPFTKRPVTNVIATWVIADTALVADGLATALFFVEDTASLLSEFQFTFVRLFNDGTVDCSPAFDGELFI